MEDGRLAAGAWSDGQFGLSFFDTSQGETVTDSMTGDGYPGRSTIVQVLAVQY